MLPRSAGKGRERRERQATPDSNCRSSLSSSFTKRCTEVKERSESLGASAKASGDARHDHEQHSEERLTTTVPSGMGTLVSMKARCGEYRGGLTPWQKLKVDRYLRAHLAESVHLRDLAIQVSLSVSHFCRTFKESFGVTPHRRIIELRLEAARRLMLTTEDRLSQIAITCGLADQAHLSKLFRRACGETPGAWRQRSLNQSRSELGCGRPMRSSTV